MQYSDRKKNPYRFVFRNSFEITLWIILLFFFNYDIYVPDFEFISTPIIVILTILGIKAVIRPYRQFWLRVDNKKLYTFKEWKTVKQKFKRN